MKPAVSSAWLALSDEQTRSFSQLILNCPERFTSNKFWSLAADYRQYIDDPSKATYILYLYSYLWEVSDDFESLHFKPEIIKI